MVDADGTPQADVEWKISLRPKAEPYWDEGCFFPDSIKTDREGRFRIDALLPGFDYFLNSDRASHFFSGELRAGETHDPLQLEWLSLFFSLSRGQGAEPSGRSGGP